MMIFNCKKIIFNLQIDKLDGAYSKTKQVN